MIHTRTGNNRKFHHVFILLPVYYLSWRVKHAKQITSRNFVGAETFSYNTGNSSNFDNIERELSESGSFYFSFLSLFLSFRSFFFHASFPPFSLFLSLIFFYFFFFLEANGAPDRCVYPSITPEISSFVELPSVLAIWLGVSITKNKRDT